MLTRIRELLSPPTLENEEDALAASLLHTILLILAAAGFVVPLVLNIIAILNPDDEIPFDFITLVMGLIVPGLVLWLLQLAKQGRVRLASAIMTGTLFLLTTSTIATFRGTRDTAAGMYILVIAMAGLLLGGRAAITFTFLSLGVTLLVYLAEVNGLLTITLTETPEIVEWIIFAVIVLLLGFLLRFAFETLNRALRGAREANEALESVQASLAERVAARTKDLELAAEVGRNLSRMRESEEILLEAVELIRSRFDLYYTQIYLMDAARNNLVLRAGTGAVGRQLRQLGHRLPLSTSSINGTAVINKEPVIVSDTAESSIFRQNPLLPDTRSEMAIPLIVSESVIGSLNLQSVIPGGLSEENLPAFEALAGQLAVALDNARLFTEAAETQDALESLAQRLTRSGWDNFLNAIERQENIRYTYDFTHSEFVESPVQAESNPAFTVPIRLGQEVLGKIEVQGNEWHDWQKEDQDLAAAVAQRVAQQVENIRLLSETDRYRTEAEEATRRLTREGWETYIQKQLGQPEGYIYDQQEVAPLSDGNGHYEEPGLVHPLIVRGEPIGQFEIDGVLESNEETTDLVDAVAERLSAHIENLRLSTQTEIALAETERRAEELAVINTLARAVSQQLNLDSILETVYKQLRRVLSVDAYIVGLYEQETNLISYPLIYDEGVRYEEGAYQLDKETTIYEVLTTGKALVVSYESEDDLPRGEVLEQNALGNENKPSRSMMFVPLIFSNYPVGVISVQSYQFDAYDDTDLALVEGIANHLSVAIQNAQLFEQTQTALAVTEDQASRLALLSELGQALTQATTLEEVYEVTAERAHKILDSDRTSIALLTEDGEHYEILALGGEKGSSEVGKPQRLEDSSVGVAIQENRLVVVNKSEDSGISGIYAFMVAPLIASGQVIGTLNIGSKSTDVFGPRDERLIIQIASLLATTIESRRLLAQTQQRAEELRVINRVAQTVSRATEQEQMLENVLEEISKIFTVDAFLVGLYEPDTDLLEYPLVYDGGKRHKLEADHPSPGSMVARILKEQEPTLILRTPEEVEEKAKNLPPTMVGDITKVSASLIYVPLILGRRSTGAFSIQSYEYNAYKPEDLKLLEGIANHVAVALENVRLFEETERRAEEQAVINEIAQAVSRQIEQEELLETVYEQVRRVMLVDAFSVAIYNPETEMIHFVMVVDEGEQYDEAPAPLGDGAISRVIKEGQPILVNRTQEQLDELALKQDLVMIGNVKRLSASMIYTPLKIGAETIGGLAVHSYELNAYDEPEVELLMGVANHLAIALENARLFEETQATLGETELLYEMGTRINRATTLEDLVKVVAVPGIAPGAHSAGLFRFEQDEEGQAEWMELEANWALDGAPVLEIGTRLHLPELPLAAAELYTPNNPMLIDNIATDERVDHSAKVLLRGLNTKAMAIIPMQQIDTWIGTLVIRWRESYTFTEREQRLYNSLSRQMSTALSNQLLLSETQERATQLEIINQIETALSQADDEVGILEGLAPLLEKEQSVSLHYTAEEVGPATAFTVAHWENNRIKEDDSRLYRPFDIQLQAGLALGLENPDRISYVSDIKSDVRISKKVAKEARKNGYRAIMVIPLRSAGRWQGFLTIKWPATHDFSVAESSIWEQLREPLAAIIASRRAYLAQQEALSETAALYESVAQLSVARSYDEVLEVIRQNTAMGENVNNISIMLFEHGRRRDEMPAFADVLTFWSKKAPDKATLRFYFDRYPSAEKILQQTESGPLVINDVQESAEIDENMKKMLVKGFNTNTYVLFPMIVRGEYIGYVNAMYPQRTILSNKEIRRTEAIIQQASVAVQGLRNLEQAEHQAIVAQNRSDELASINRVVTTVTSTFDLGEMLDAVASELITLFSVQHVGITLINPEKTALTVVADRSSNPEAESAVGLDIPLVGNKLSNQVIETRRPVVVENAQTNPLTEPIHDVMRWRETQVLVLLPLFSGRETVGTLGLDITEEDRTFTEAELKLAETIVAQIATAVRNIQLFEQTEARAKELARLNEETARLFEQAQARSEELTILNEMGRSLTALVDMDAILDNVYRYTSRLMDANNFYIAFWNGKRNEITFALDIRGERVMRNVGTRKAGKGLTEHIIQTKEPILIPENVDKKLDELGIEQIGPQAASWLGVPLMVGSQVIGVIGLQNWDAPRTYNEQHMRLLTSVAAQAAIAIENARLFEQIQARARRERILREVTAKVRGATDADSVMRTAVQEIGRALGRPTFVYLNSNEEQTSEPTREEAYGD